MDQLNDIPDSLQDHSTQRLVRFLWSHLVHLFSVTPSHLSMICWGVCWLSGWLSALSLKPRPGLGAGAGAGAGARSGPGSVPEPLKACGSAGAGGSSATRGTLWLLGEEAEPRLPLRCTAPPSWPTSRSILLPNSATRWRSRILKMSSDSVPIRSSGTSCAQPRWFRNSPFLAAPRGVCWKLGSVWVRLRGLEVEGSRREGKGWVGLESPPSSALSLSSSSSGDSDSEASAIWGDAGRRRVVIRWTRLYG